MKKHLGITLVLITILSLTACVSNKKIILLKAEKVKEIEIMKNTSEDRLKIENQDEIFGIIADIEENTKDTAREVLTINLQILMIILSLNSITKNADDSPSVDYLYKGKNRSIRFI